MYICETYNEAYTFDDDNRMLTKTKDGTQYSFSYLSNTHAISAITMTGAKSGNISFNYDDFGKMISKTTTIGASVDTMNFGYSENDDLISIQMSNGFELDFKYDNKGQRIKKTFKDAVSTLSDNTYVNGFYDIKDGSVNKHISDGQYIIATLVDNNYNNVLYYTQNNIGSTSMLTDKDSNKVQSYLFTPYGEPWVTENPTVDVDRKFTGQMYDKESGLYYMNSRYMDPKVGIYIIPDPAMQGLNHYAYCSSNPINYVDPTGMWDDCSCIDNYSYYCNYSSFGSSYYGGYYNSMFQSCWQELEQRLTFDLYGIGSTNYAMDTSFSNSTLANYNSSFNYGGNYSLNTSDISSITNKTAQNYSNFDTDRISNILNDNLKAEIEIEKPIATTPSYSPFTGPTGNIQLSWTNGVSFGDGNFGDTITNGKENRFAEMKFTNNISFRGYTNPIQVESTLSAGQNSATFGIGIGEQKSFFGLFNYNQINFYANGRSISGNLYAGPNIKYRYDPGTTLSVLIVAGVICAPEITIPALAGYAWGF